MERPLTSQIVIERFTNIIDSQDKKGFEKYGKTIDNANNADYNWELMALEETADLQKYLVRRIIEVAGELTKAKLEIKHLKTLSRVSKCLQLEEENLKLVQENDESGRKMINNLCKEAYLIAKSKGWHDEERENGTVFALIHSEVSEALEADRRGNEEQVAEELADVCIRIFDFCGSKGIDLESAISNKMEFNKTRNYKHGGKAY